MIDTIKVRAQPRSIHPNTIPCGNRFHSKDPTNYKATMSAKTDPARTPEMVRTLLVSITLAAPPVEPALEAVPELVDKA